MRPADAVQSPQRFALSLGPSEHQASHKVWLTALDAQGVYRAIHFE